LPLWLIQLIDHLVDIGYARAASLSHRARGVALPANVTAHWPARRCMPPPAPARPLALMGGRRGTIPPYHTMPLHRRARGCRRARAARAGRAGRG
jgi:hypothetical protein